MCCLALQKQADTLLDWGSTMQTGQGSNPQDLMEIVLAFGKLLDQVKATIDAANEKAEVYLIALLPCSSETFFMQCHKIFASQSKLFCIPDLTWHEI